jgi:hypothetical protein
MGMATFQLLLVAMVVLIVFFMAMSNRPKPR